MNTNDLQHQLDRDAAALWTTIAAAAPGAGLSPTDIARIDQLAAEANDPANWYPHARRRTR